jgi:hypothetical protein
MDTASGTPGTTERVEVAYELLTIKEAAAAMRVSLSLGYQLAHEYLNSGGTAGCRFCGSAPACASLGGRSRC